MKQLITILLLLLPLAKLLKANEPSTGLVQQSLVHGWNNAKTVIHKPFRLNRHDMVLIGAISAATAASVFWADEPIREFSLHHQSDQAHRFFTVIEPVGSYYPLAIAGGLMIHGFGTKNNKSLETALMLGEAMLINQAITQIVKTIAGRQRPNSTDNLSPLHWDGPLHGRSFYSSHTSGAFAAATILAKQYHHQKWVPPTAFTLATLGAIQRIYHQEHWLSDTLFGAAAGTAIGLIITNNKTSNPFSFYPSIGTQSTSLTVVYKMKR